MLKLEIQKMRSEAIYVVDSDRNILYSCRSYHCGDSETGLQEGDVCQIICDNDLCPCENCFIQRAFAADHCISEQRHNGSTEILLRAWPLDIEELGRKLLVVFWQDITSQKDLEAQLFHSQKLEAIGELAAGVAHEINNPLGFIYGNLKTMNEYAAVMKKVLTLSDQLCSNNDASVEDILGQLRKIDEKENFESIMNDLDGLLQDSINGAIRVTEIVSNLKSFARPDSHEKKDYNVNDGLRSTLKILNNEIKYKCDLVEQYGEVPDIHCYPGELNQVFINIIANAAQAIETQGEIRIKTYCDKDYVYVSIGDTGSGIDKKVIKNIFDPFFTTKPVGKGTGLGLSVSHGIVEKHNGSIEVKSEVGVGTEFIIALPVT